MRLLFAPRFPQIAALVSVVLLAIPSYSQQPAATISGAIRSVGENQPIRGVMVRLFTPDGGGQDAIEYTDGEGRFRFTDLPAGRYRINGFKDGYLEGKYGAKHWQENAVLFSLAAGEQKVLENWEMARSGSVSGTVRGPDGIPAVGMPLQLHTVGSSSGKRVLTGFRSAQTDSHGEYRLVGVPPGNYVLSCDPHLMPVAISSVVRLNDPAPQRQVYVVQYYPGVEDPEQAALLTISPGQQVSGIDLPLRSRPMHRVNIKVQFPGAVASTPHAGARVALITKGTARTMAQGVTSAVDQDLWFERVPPGRYQVVAEAAIEQTPYSAVAQLEVGDAPPPPLFLRLEPPLTLTGTVQVEGDAAGQFRRFEVGLFSQEYSSRRVRASTDQNLRFSLSGILPGNWEVTINPVPPGGYLKSMRLGDQDVMHKQLSLEGSTRSPLKIVLGTKGATLTGAIAGAAGNVGRGFILTAPADRAADSKWWRLSSTNETGEYKLMGIPPGKLKVVCLLAATGVSRQDTDLLLPFLKQAEQIDVVEGSTQKLDLHCPDLPAGGKP